MESRALKGRLNEEELESGAHTYTKSPNREAYSMAPRDTYR